MLYPVKTDNTLTEFHRQIQAAIQNILLSPSSSILITRILTTIKNKYQQSATDQEREFWSDWYCRFTIYFSHQTNNERLLVTATSATPSPRRNCE